MLTDLKLNYSESVEECKMPNINDTVEIARRILPIIYVIDSSGSMIGEKIASVNEAMKDAMDLLKDISAKNPDAEIKVGVLKFSSGAEWIKPLTDLEDYYWNNLNAGGVTDIGSALDELNKKLSKNEFLKSDVGFCIPVIMFMSDGEPTDDYEKALKNINETNKWFRHSTKIAIAVGESANKDVLAKIVGNMEAVVSVNDIEALKMLIKVASVTSSLVNSKSRTSADGNNAVEIIRSTTKELGDASDKIGTHFGEGTPASVQNTVTSGDSWSDDDWN